MGNVETPLGENASSPGSNARLLRLATTLSVATAAGLIGAKLLAWLMTGSMSVLSSLVDSLMDAAASIINLFAIRYSLNPADTEHRFGHGKAESLAALTQSAFIAGSAVFLIVHAVDRVRHPRPLEDVAIGVGVMLVAMAATLGLLTVQRHVIRRTGSTAIRADSLHYTTDLLTNLGIIAALLLSSYGWPGLDPIFAMVVAGYILLGAWRIGSDAFQVLMDRELPSEIQDRIREIALKHPQVRGVHDLRTRQSGQERFIQLHLELDDDLPLIRAHAIATDVSEEIGAAIPGAQVILHEDPVSLRDRPGRRLWGSPT